MGDQLEKFIVKNREAFNDSSPSENAWNKIDQTLNRKEPNWASLWKVAAIIFMASTLYLIINKQTSNVSDGPTLSEEFVQAEGYYIDLITEKTLLIQEKLTPEQQKEFLTEIDELDGLYSDLKKTYQTNASNDRVVDAMITNLQLRLNILNRQLEILQKIKNQDNDRNTSIEI